MIGNPYNRLEFRETLYMDRYMSQNREQSRILYQTRRRLDDQIDEKESITKALLYRDNMRIPEALKCVINLSQEYTSRTADLPESDISNHPFPGELTREQIQSVENILTPWLASIEAQHQTLKDQCSNWRQERRSLYDFNEYKNEKYMLNGVIIHQGEAGAGHYWAYVRDAEENWWRCNDNEVKKSEYFEIEREGFGGSENGSSQASKQNSTYANQIFASTSSD